VAIGKRATGSSPCWSKRMWIGCAIRVVPWPRPIGDGWVRARAVAGMIGGASIPNPSRTCGFMSCTPKPAPNCKPARSKSWHPVRCLRPPSKEDWAEEEMAGVALGDQRLNERAQRMLRHRWPSQPTASTAASARRPRPKAPINYWKTLGMKSIWRACWRRTSNKPPGAWPPKAWCCWPKTPPP